MDKLLNYCNQQLIELPCCHNSSSKDIMCDCYRCLRKGFYATADSYECLKKLNYYVLNYGPSYSSEVYHYLSASKLLEKKFSNSKIKIVSLGCGFAPDLIALNKYIKDNNLNVKLDYMGIDNSEHWTPMRPKYRNAQFLKQDIMKGFDLSGFDVVFMLKLFSTLYKSDLDEKFLVLLKNQINSSMKKGSFLIFNDVNSRHMGRDYFHREINPLFSKYKQFYCDDPPYYESSWIKIPEEKIVYKLPTDLEIIPLRILTKTVFFEYKK